MDVYFNEIDHQADKKLCSKTKRMPREAVPSVMQTIQETSETAGQRQAQWRQRLLEDRSCFAAVELEVHQYYREQADLLVASLLGEVGAQPEIADHAEKIRAESTVALRPPEKKTRRTDSSAGWAHTVCQRALL